MIFFITSDFSDTSILTNFFYSTHDLIIQLTSINFSNSSILSLLNFSSKENKLKISLQPNCYLWLNILLSTCLWYSRVLNQPQINPKIMVTTSRLPMILRIISKNLLYTIWILLSSLDGKNTIIEIAFSKSLSCQQIIWVFMSFMSK